MQKGLAVVDVTATVRAIHQTFPTLGLVENSHMARRINDGMMYNHLLWDAFQ